MIHELVASGKWPVVNQKKYKSIASPFSHIPLATNHQPLYHCPINMNKRVVVTGIGIVSPLGIGKQAHWDALCAGQIAIDKIKSFDASGFACSIGGEVPEYRIGDHVPKSYRKATKVMARDIELAVIAANDAINDAKIQTRAHVEKPEFDAMRFGCNIGAGLISAELNELTYAMNQARGSGESSNQLDLNKWGKEGMEQLTPLWLLKYLPNMLACHVTIIHGLMGPSNTITCQDASSHLAIGEAFRTIQRGKADWAICGGAESRLNPMGIMRQQLLGKLNNSNNESPKDAVKPFDVKANGSVFGEGGGLLVLEEYEHAKARGATIYAELAGFGASQDTYSNVEPDPTGYCYGRALAKSLLDADVVPSDVDLIVPHGLGIAKFDQAELNGMVAVFGTSIDNPCISPMKSQTGTLGAGSGADVAGAVLSIFHQIIPPATNTRVIHNDVRLNVAPEARKEKVDVAIASTYSQGGQNAALVFKRV